jgi:uncharacterized protein (TIGR03437 family)
MILLRPFIKTSLAIVLFSFCLRPLVTAQTTGWRWREIAPVAGQAKPEARRNGAAIYDPVGKRVILFGGASDSGLLNDTWSLDPAGGGWTKLTTNGPTPPARMAFDAVYDPVGRQMVIYSGQGAGFFNDTWTLDLATLTWRDVSPAANNARPKARYGSASIFDPVSRSLVQFAGFTSESGRFQDTQSFSLSTNAWADWTPAGTKPQIRCLLTAAFDQKNRRMIIYGGQRNGPLDDLWSFDLAARSWTSLTPSDRPAGRWFSTSFFGTDGRFYIFGGYTSNGNSDELWSFDFSNNRWSRIALPASPSARNGSMSAYIESENRFVIFGGAGNSGLLNDVWELRASAPATITAVSAASFDGSALAIESIASAFGSDLTATTEIATSRPLPTTLGGVTLRLKDSAGAERTAPLFFVSPGQLNFQIPPGTATGVASLTLATSTGSIATGTVPVAEVAPSLFTATATGQGLAAALALRVRNGQQSFEPIARYDAAQNRVVAVPLDLGPETDQVFLILYGTGLRYRSGVSGVRVKLGGTDAPVLFAGVQSDFVGLDQVNIAVPRSLAGRGEVEISLTVDGKNANPVKITVN